MLAIAPPTTISMRTSSPPAGMQDGAPLDDRADVAAVLSILTPDGKAWTLTQGHARIANPENAFDLPMRAVCVTIAIRHGTSRLILPDAT